MPSIADLFWRGSVIGILNADDFLGGAGCSEDYSAFDISRVAGVYGDLLYVRWRRILGPASLLARRSVAAHPFRGVDAPHRTTYLRKSVNQQFGGFRTDFASAADYEFALRLMKHQHSLHYVPEILFAWELRDEQSFVSSAVVGSSNGLESVDAKQLVPGLLTVPLEPFRKLPQFWQRQKDFIFPEWAMPGSAGDLC